MKAASVIFFFLFVTGVLRAQQTMNPATDTIRWEYDTILNLTNEEVISLSGHVISYGNHAFVWAQNGVADPYSFTAVSTEGVWPDAGTGGEITHQITWQDQTGSIKMSRNGDTIKIQIDFGEPGGLMPHIILQVDTLTKI
jgi:hypothetical protein